jgi:uncharacterized DUF497 family protein
VRAEVLAGECSTVRDERQNYGEERFVSLGVFRGRLVFVAWTSRESKYRITTMRKANAREQIIHATWLRGKGGVV